MMGLEEEKELIGFFVFDNQYSIIPIFSLGRDPGVRFLWYFEQRRAIFSEISSKGLDTNSQNRYNPLKFH
jgi:hypothetical protein